MNKELFVSSTPHETKVGLVEDDLLAEVYLERENEYTLAGSIYKGRVTRVLPGMQSAFVDIGLERDAFLYVSDFMELEEHDDDLTDVVPANRGVQDMRQQPARAEGGNAAESGQTSGVESELAPMQDEGTFEADALSEGEPAVSAEGSEPASGDSQGRDRGNWRGRRRRRGGRRDGRDRGSDRGADRTPERNADRPQESRPSRPSRSFFGSYSFRSASWLPANSATRRIDFEIPAFLAAGTRTRDSSFRRRRLPQRRMWPKSARTLGRDIPRG